MYIYMYMYTYIYIYVCSYVHMYIRIHFLPTKLATRTNHASYSRAIVKRRSTRSLVGLGRSSPRCTRGFTPPNN